MQSSLMELKWIYWSSWITKIGLKLECIKTQKLPPLSDQEDGMVSKEQADLYIYYNTIKHSGQIRIQPQNGFEDRYGEDLFSGLHLYKACQAHKYYNRKISCWDTVSVSFLSSV